MAHTRVRVRIGSATLRFLFGALLALGLFSTAFATSSAQGIPGLPGGLPGGFDQGDWDEEDGGWDDGDWEDSGIPSARDLCLSVFPGGIITGDPVIGDIDCSTIFGGAPPTEEPTYEPTEEPTYEPTKEPDHDYDKDHDYNKDHDHDYNKDHDDNKDHDYNKDHDHDYNTDHDYDKKHDHDGYGKKDDGGKAYPTVTTMPSTGHAVESSDTMATATFLAAMALVLATLSGVTLRLTGARNSRR